MSSDIYARPDVSKKARYTRKVEEDGGEWEEREVVIYQSVDDIRPDPNGFQSQEGDISGTLEKDQLKNKVSANNSQLQDEVKRLNTETHELKTNNSQLQDEVKRLNTETRELKTNNSQLQDEVKRVNRETHVLKTNNSQLQDEVKRLNTETHDVKTNNSQLQDEVKKLKDVIEGKCCPEGWMGFGWSCYFKSTQKKTWDESRRDCQNKGADLVTINNNEEQEFVRRLSMNEESWIGLEDTWTSQGYEWKWVDGSPLTVTFWASREPQYSYSYDYDYDYAACYNQQGQWISVYSSYQKNWICEKHISCFH